LCTQQRWPRVFGHTSSSACQKPSAAREISSILYGADLGGYSVATATGRQFGTEAGGTKPLL